MVILSWLGPSLAFTQDLTIPGQHPLTDIEEIELVYAGTQPVPKIIVRRAQAANSFVLSSYRPPAGRLDLLAQTVGQRIVGNQTTQLSTDLPTHALSDHQKTATFGMMWSLQTANKSLDALSFRTLRVRGTTSSPMKIELVEEVPHRHRTHTIAEHLTGRFALEIPLATLGQRIDLRRLTQLQLLSEQSADIVMEELAFLGPESEVLPTPAIGFWYWDYHSALRDPNGMLNACQQYHCRRILLQLPDMRDSDQTWAAYAQLFPLAHSAGIELFALDGAPDMIDHATLLIEKLDRLLTLAGSQIIPAVQLDIEPYLLDGFPEDQTIFERYLGTIDRVKTALQARTKLSIVIPFWFASTIHRDRPIAFSVMDRVDEVAVMSYRTDVDELIAISDDILRYGVLGHVPVWLALETTNLPLERHVILKRETRAASADGSLDPIRRTLSLGPPTNGDAPKKDHMWFRIHHRTTVHPERVTFAGQTEPDVRRMTRDLFARIHHSSFSGLVIHDLPGYQALQP